MGFPFSFEMATTHKTSTAILIYLFLSCLKSFKGELFKLNCERWGYKEKAVMNSFGRALLSFSAASLYL